MKKIDAFILFTDPQQAHKTVAELQKTESINKIYLLTPSDTKDKIKGCKNIQIDSLYSSSTIKT
ncbi:MAG: glycosyltransferase family 2 protein, partial [Fermentimonas sp.]|nr:glycosyltransferase family 2 protein [Fermentimonas sp.]